MKNNLNRVLYPALQQSLLTRNGAAATTEWVTNHPFFADTWNAAMSAVHSDYIERAYLQPQRVLVRFIDAGRITSLDQLRAMTVGVIRLTARHFNFLSHRKENPRLRKTKSTDAAMTHGESLPLFVAMECDALFAGREDDPSEAAAARLDAPHLVHRFEAVQPLARLEPSRGRVRTRTWQLLRCVQGGRPLRNHQWQPDDRRLPPHGRRRPRGTGSGYRPSGPSSLPRRGGVLQGSGMTTENTPDGTGMFF